jgi:hypothetical protein
MGTGRRDPLSREAGHERAPAKMVSGDLDVHCTDPAMPEASSRQVLR